MIKPESGTEHDAFGKEGGRCGGCIRSIPHWKPTDFLHGKGEYTMCGNNFNGCWWIIILILLFCGCGNGYGNGCGNSCGNNCGCDNGCGCGC
ncbi:MAG: hypothetical protein IKL87_06570 [Oscillospiraceae bacterium]|nr:hypothetical protein [Oscillospiraceae bacterium]